MVQFFYENVTIVTVVLIPGLFPTSDLVKLRTLDSDLEGHPTPRLNFVDVATGSLGQVRRRFWFF